MTIDDDFSSSAASSPFASGLSALPAGCPVEPLGIAGRRCYYRGSDGRITALDIDLRHGKNSLIGLFGSKNHWLAEHYPLTSGDARSGRAGFDQVRAAAALIAACAQRGVLSDEQMAQFGDGAPRSASSAWHHARVLWLTADRALDDYDRMVVQPAEDRGAPRATLSALEDHYDQLLDMRMAALAALIAQPAPDLAAAAYKMEVMMDNRQHGYDDFERDMALVRTDIAALRGEG